VYVLDLCSNFSVFVKVYVWSNSHSSGAHFFVCYCANMRVCYFVYYMAQIQSCYLRSPSWIKHIYKFIINQVAACQQNWGLERQLLVRKKGKCPRYKRLVFVVPKLAKDKQTVRFQLIYLVGAQYSWAATQGTLQVRSRSSKRRLVSLFLTWHLAGYAMRWFTILVSRTFRTLLKLIRWSQGYPQMQCMYCRLKRRTTLWNASPVGIL